MFHKAVSLTFKEGTVLELAFQTGETKRYDMAVLFEKYPQLEALKNRELFISGKLAGSYGIMWNDDLDIEAETIYEDGITVKTEKASLCMAAANAVYAARAKAGISQSELSAATGIDQSDISKIERGLSNPSVNTLARIAKALGTQLAISFVPSDKAV